MKPFSRLIINSKYKFQNNFIKSLNFSSKSQHDLKHYDSNLCHGEVKNAQNAIANEVPHSKGLPLVGTLFSLILAGGGPNLHLYIDKRHKEFGPIFRESLGPVDGVFVSDPHIMRKIYGVEGKQPLHVLPEVWLIYNEMYGSKRGIYFMDGDEWQNYRRILNKVFLTNYVSSDYDIVQNAVIQDWIDRWRILVNCDIEIDETEFHRLSISYVVATLIGENYLKYKNDFEMSIDRLTYCAHTIFKESCKLNLMPAKWAVSLNLPPWRKFKKAVDEALSQGELMVKQIEQVGSADGLLKKLISENVTGDILKRIIVDLILAAGDTTSFTSQWSLYLLSRHSKVQERLIENPEDVLLLKGIVKETLRLYPAAPFITRFLPKDTILGGYHVKRGQLVVMSLYSSSRNEKYFPHSDEFLPERWERKGDGCTVNDDSLAANWNYSCKGVVEPNASQPFAMGVRSCIGRKLAESQLTRMLSKVAYNFRLDSLGEVDMVLHFIPVPKTPIKIRISSANRMSKKSDEQF